MTGYEGLVNRLRAIAESRVSVMNAFEVTATAADALELLALRVQILEGDLERAEGERDRARRAAVLLEQENAAAGFPGARW